ncbi:MAG: sigma-70 family RNA polymerase sigma factor [Solirubrobacterales bacterium]
MDVGRTADTMVAARRRAAVELIRARESTLRRTARRYSLCADDAEDALQRAFEILLTKAPTSDQRQLIRWMQTVTKHEALAVRRNRERHLGAPPPGRAEDSDWVQLIPSETDGPADTAERRERIARAREALKALKPQELRALTLLAEGYSYAEIGKQTGWSYTKVNRCLAEGRQRFRAVFGSIEEGRRCEELAPALSAFVDGETSSRLTAQLQAHLRDCSYCRSEVRAYRAAPRAAAALAPALPAAQSLGDRLHDLVATVQSRLPGRTGATETAISQLAAAGGTRGTGMAIGAKILAACVGTAGGAAACVAGGVVPPVDLGANGDGPKIERAAEQPGSADSVPSAQPIAESTPPPAPEPAPELPPTPEPEPEPPPPPPSVATEFSPEVSAAPTATRAGSAGVPIEANASNGGGGGGPPAAGSRGEFGP